MSKKVQAIDVEATEVDTAEGPSLYEQVVDWLAQKDWKFDPSDDHNYLSFALRLHDGSVRVNCSIYDQPTWKRLTVWTHYYTFVPEYRRAEVAQALNLINGDIPVGNFEMDVSDGVVRVHTCHECDTVVSEAMVDRVIRRSLDLAEQYQAALLGIAFGNIAASKVIELGARNSDTALQ
jgi:hypothetical protein